MMAVASRRLLCFVAGGVQCGMLRTSMLPPGATTPLLARASPYGCDQVHVMRPFQLVCDTCWRKPTCTSWAALLSSQGFAAWSTSAWNRSGEERSGQPVGTDAIHIRGARFYGYHGVLPAENQVGQPFLVDVSMFCDLKQAGVSDALEHTVSYADAFSLVRGIMEGPPHRLLESLAHRIACELLTTHPPIHAVRIGINKLHIPNLSAAVSSVGVEVFRQRNDLQPLAEPQGRPS